MTNHLSRPHDDDPTEADALARVNRLRAAWGREPIMERDPNDVRSDLATDRDATMLAVAALRRRGAGDAVPAAYEAATHGWVGDMFDVVPYAVAAAICDRLPTEHQPAVFDAVDEVLERFYDTPGGWAHAQLCVHWIADAVRAGFVVSIVDKGSGAIDHATGQPVAEPADQLPSAADFAAGIAYADLIDRLQIELASLAGMPTAVETIDREYESVAAVHVC